MVGVDVDPNHPLPLARLHLPTQNPLRPQYIPPETSDTIDPCPVTPVMFERVWTRMGPSHRLCPLPTAGLLAVHHVDVL